MRALRVVIADGGLMPRSDIAVLCERAGFDVVGEAPEWSQIPEIVQTRAAEVVLVSGDPDFARGLSAIDGRVPAIVLAPDARATKEYADSGASAVLTPTAEPEVIWATASMAVSRFSEYRAAREEVGKLKDQLETRKGVERAKGVLMRRLGVSEDEAYRKIQRASQDENKKMREIAESILSAERLYEPGESPSTPEAPASPGDIA